MATNAATVRPRSTASRVDSAEGLVASAQENFEAVRAAYAFGLATVSEFFDAAGQLALSQSSRATTVAEYSTSRAALAFATGLPPVAEKAKTRH
ncbi:MAG: TolC family protein [Verrucomicrobiae bacterium]